jgi:MFS family permease
MKRVIWQFYGFQFFFSLLLWLPIFYEYQKNIGLNDTQIFSIQSIYYIVFCLMEIPTGYFADRFGHRDSLCAGAVILVVSNLLPIFFQDYSGLLTHFILIALSRSLISGASSAYIYDYLQTHSALGIYKQIEGNARAYGLFGKVACWAAVGPLMQWHLTLPYWLTAGSASIAVVFAFALPPLKAVVATHQEGFRLKLLSIFELLRKTPILVFLMLQGVAIFVLVRLCQVNLYQPILSAKTFDLSTFGMIMSLMTIFEAIGSLRPGWTKRLMTDFNAVYFLTLIMAGCLLLIPNAEKFGVLAYLCLFSFATGVSFPIQRQLMNDAIPNSNYRATLLSVESILDRAVNAWLASLIGVYLTQGRLSDFLVLTGVGAVVLTVILFLIGLTPVLTKNKRVV